MIGRWLLPLVLVATALAGCVSSPAPPSPPVLQGDAACGGSAAFAGAALANSQSLDGLDWSPFGAPERGWRVYAPAIAVEVGTACAPDSGEFAARLAGWQAAHGLAADGRVSAAAFAPMKAVWQGRRPFLAVRARGICPDPPDEASLAAAVDGDGVEGRTVLLAPDALAAFSRMRAAALADLGIDRSAQTLAVFSGYRSPAYDAARCAQEHNCQGIVRAQCSAHRTGLALDLVLGVAPGHAADAADAANRLYQSQTPAYRWLVANAGRFGFVNYVFEPWHWEWTGRPTPDR